MTQPIRIGLVFSQSLAYCRGVLRGVKQFAESCPHWTFLLVAPEVRAVRALHRLKPAGVIAHIFSECLWGALSQLDVALVNVSGVLPDLPMPRVGVDDYQCGSLAADHFLARGLRHFAFVGHRNHAYSLHREAGFRQGIERAGFQLECYYERGQRPFHPTGRLWAPDVSIQRWIRSLPKPVGIFAPNDIWGVQLAEVCLQTGLQVPEEVAILGVDDDDLLCGLARPSLSSIALPTERIGYQASFLLNRLLARPRSRPHQVLLPPLGVVARRSTDMMALADAEVADALRFIWTQGHRPIRVTDILRQVPISRRALERRFRKVLRRSLLQEIRRVHIARAKDLLAMTDLSMHIVAERSGFPGAARLSTVFRQEVRLTPTAYRHQFRCRTSE